MDVSMQIQRALSYGQTEVALDTSVEEISEWMGEILGREAELDVDFFVSDVDTDTSGNEIQVVTFDKNLGLDLAVIVNAD